MQKSKGVRGKREFTLSERKCSGFKYFFLYHWFSGGLRDELPRNVQDIKRGGPAFKLGANLVGHVIRFSLTRVRSARIVKKKTKNMDRRQERGEMRYKFILTK